VCLEAGCPVCEKPSWGVMGALHGPGQQGSPASFVWCEVPGQIPALRLGWLPPSLPCSQQVGSAGRWLENCMLRAPHVSQSGVAC